MSQKFPDISVTLQKANLRHFLLEDGLIFISYLSAEDVLFLIYVKYEPSAGMLYCSGLFPGEWKSPKKIKQLSKFMQIANGGVLIGNFEFDENKKELYLRVSTYFGQEEIDEQFLLLTIQTCIDGLVHYYPRVQALLQSAANPDQAWNIKS